MFKVQRDILTRYHVSNPVDFYHQSDRWQVSADPTEGTATNQDQPPYYILAQRPGDNQASYQLTSALNAFQRDNLSAFISASSAPGTYGQIQVLRLPGNTPYRGPRQVQNAFQSNNQVRPDLTLFNSSSSKAVFGNLLTLPIGNAGLLYVEPLYVRGSGENSFPLLQKVLVNYGDKIGYANTLAQALDQVFGAGAGQSATDSGGSPTTGGSSPTPTPTTTAPSTSSPNGGSGASSNPAMNQAVSDINGALAALASAQKSGDFAGIGKAEADLQKAVSAYQSAQRSGAASANKSGAKPTAAATPTG
jgi:uncharacterized membrane protein (UPF0182 family)